MKKKPLIIIAGPTASGKSEIAIKLAKKVTGEIISADSMQVYREMSIGTAKITLEEMEGIPHHLIDELDPTDPFDVTIFQRMVKDTLEGIYQRGNIPILVGGTGFYIQAVLYDIDFVEADSDKAYRKQLEEVVEQYGPEHLHSRLRAVDLESYHTIHHNNVKRVIRALEYYHLTGQPISKHNAEQSVKESPYNYCYFVLNMDRDLLYNRIEQRVEKMFKSGLVEEVKGLIQKGYDKSLTSMQGLGYKEIITALEGEYSLDEAKYIIKRDTRHFAKRQVTWFKREKEVIWLDRGDFPFNDEIILSQLIKYIEVKELMG